MIKFRKAGVWTVPNLYKRRVGGAWVDIQRADFRKAGTMTVYYEGVIMQRPPEGTYSGSAGLVFYPSSHGTYPYAIRSGAHHYSTVNVAIGSWKKTGSEFGGGDSVQLYVELVDGDANVSSSDAFNTWVPLYTGSTIRKWWAEDNSSTDQRAIFKVTMKDESNNELVFWADCSDNGPTIISYTALTWGGSGGGGGGSGGGGGEVP